MHTRRLKGAQVPSCFIILDVKIVRMSRCRTWQRVGRYNIVRVTIYALVSVGLQERYMWKEYLASLGHSRLRVVGRAIVDLFRSGGDKP